LKRLFVQIAFETKTSIFDMKFPFDGALHMTNVCRDGECQRRIYDIDDAIRHEQNVWSIILKSSQDLNDVNHALHFCEIFRLEARVKIDSRGIEVLVRDDFIRLL
jgi:predicted methyltransferase